MTRSRRKGMANDPSPNHPGAHHAIQSELVDAATSGRDFVTYAAYGLLLVLVILLCLSKLYDDDIFWQLATGRWIVQHHAIPDHDVFGFVTEGQQWIPVEWLWGVILYSAYSWTQSYGTLEILTAFVCVGILVLQILTMRGLRIATPIALLIALLVVCTALGRLVPRPHIITALGLSATVYAIYRGRHPDESNSNILYVLPPLFLVWTNMHPGVLVGMMLLALAILSGLMEIFLFRYRSQGIIVSSGRHSSRHLKKLLGVFLLCACAVLINPHGIGTYAYVYQHAQMASLGAIREWDSPFSPAAATGRLWFYKILLLLGSSSIYYSFKKKDPLPAMLYIAFALYSFQAVRLRVDFAVATAAGTALALNDLVTRLRTPAVRKFLTGKSLSIVLAILIAGLTFFVPRGSLYERMDMENRFGLGLDSAAFPVPLLDFVKREGIHGRPFNEFGIGGILVWEFPDAKNFIDSRDLNDTIMSEYISMYETHSGFEKKFQTYGIDHIMIDIPGLQRDADLMTTSPIPYFSTHRDEWKLVFWDDRSCLYLKNVPKFLRIMERYEYKTLHPYLFAYQPREFDSLRTAFPLEFERELREKLSEEPNGRVIRFIAWEVGVSPPSSAGEK